MCIETIIDVPSWLAGKKRDDTSQFGEDGYIEAALKHFGVKHKWCFEVGASDGKKFSNTFRLRADKWNAVLIEANENLFKECSQYASDKVTVIRERIDPQSLDLILAAAGAPKDLDFGVIDIDGQDFWVWAGLTVYRPRLMLVEFSPYKNHTMPALGKKNKGQAGFELIVDLGKAKGYRPLVLTNVNVLFSRLELG